MKKIILLILTAVILQGCSDFLDVRSQSIVDKDDLFTTPTGFLEALNGVYSRCTQAQLYGGELTFGFPDVLAQNYTTGVGTLYEQTVLYNYKDIDFVFKKDAVWSGLYSAISDCNLILESLETHPEVLPSEIAGLLKGEALGLRAYLHLDAYRLFGTSMRSNPDAKNIPYVKTFSTEIAPQSTGTQVLTEAITDLKSALDLLATSDPIVGSGYKVGYTTITSNTENVPDDGSNEESGNLFLQNRRHRMNYYAVCGTLARAYLCLGNKSQALQYAEEVINANKFPWTEVSDFAATEDENKDRILYKELIFGWYIDTESHFREVKTRFEEDVVENGQYSSATLGSSIYETAGTGAEDLRCRQWFRNTNMGVDILMVEKYLHSTDKPNKHYLMAPAIRLSEMYYIAAECTFPNDSEKAWGYFNTVRFNRGIGTEIRGITDEEEFLDILVTECRKEFYGEGQLFFMYKRLNRNIEVQGENKISASEKIFVLPLPQLEIESRQG